MHSPVDIDFGGYFFPLLLHTVTAFLAARKGYNLIYWFFGGGILGLLVLAFRPFANGKGRLSPHEAHLQRDSGNRIGIALAAANILWLIIRLIAW